MAGPLPGGSAALLAAGALTLLAAIAHLACIVLGAQAYRTMGAGERMVRAVEAGRLRPTLVTLAVAAVLVTWAAYAFSAAGWLPALPGVAFVLPAVSAVLLARAAGQRWLKPVFRGNSDTFWRVSSALCALLGALYAWGAAGGG